ncbi:MAG: hypothetical protein RIT27_537 [Pseudomonadota bacterium]|jgi:hypothetical protein
MRIFQRKSLSNWAFQNRETVTLSQRYVVSRACREINACRNKIIMGIMIVLGRVVKP